MNFIDFIKTKISEDSPVGDLAQAIQSDREFPIDRDAKGMMNYIDFKAGWFETRGVFEELVSEYEEYLMSNPSSDKQDSLMLGKEHILFSEKWERLKKNFNFDMVYLTGKDNDIYRVTCFNSKNNQSLKFELKSNINLNDLALKERNKPTGNLTKQYAIKKAIELLQSCEYGESTTKPNNTIFSGLMDLLEMNLKT